MKKYINIIHKIIYMTIGSLIENLIEEKEIFCPNSIPEKLTKNNKILERSRLRLLVKK